MMKTPSVILLLLGFVLSPANGADVRMFNTLADLASWVPSTLSSNFTVRTYDSSRPFASARPGHYDPSSTAATNLGCVYATSTGVGRLVFDDCDSGEIDVRWFGAAPDDGLDDTISLQAAIDYALTIRSVVYLRGGTSGGIYQTTNTLVLTNLPNNTVRFSALIGEGPGKSRILHQGFNNAVIRFRGLYARISGLTIGYSNKQGNTNDASSCILMPGFSAKCELSNLQLVNGGFGIRGITDGTGGTVFSCSIDNISIEDCNKGIEWSSSSGNSIRNVYITASGLPFAERAIADNAAGSTWDQINIEHTNWRNTPIYIGNDPCRFGLLHFEGNRLLNSEAVISIAASAVSIDHLRIINNYFHGYVVSSITHDGAIATLTVDEQGSNRSGGIGFAVGDTVLVSGATDALYNGAQTVVSVTTNALTYTMAGTPASDAEVDLSGGHDYISVHRGSTMPLSAVFQTELYGGGSLSIRTLSARDNRVIASSSGSRNGILVYNEFSGRKGRISAEQVQFGSIFKPGSGTQLAPISIVASQRGSGYTTIWTVSPHRLSTNDLVYYQALTTGLISLTNWTVATIPTEFSFTVADAGSVVPFTREVGFGSAFPVVAFVTSKSRTSNIATVGTDRAHNLKVGYKIVATRFSDSTYNNTAAVVLSVPTTTNFTYRSVSADAVASSESQAVLGVFDAGISPFLSTSTHTGLRNFGHLFSATTALESNVFFSGYSLLTTNTVVMARVGDSVSLSPFSSTTWNPSILVDGYVNANQSVVVRRYNAGLSTTTNDGSVWAVKVVKP